VLAISAAAISCKKVTDPVNYGQTNLVADTAGYAAARIDANLNNAWGIAFGPSGAINVAANHSGMSITYDKDGNQMGNVINIPLDTDANGASPDGAVYNTTSSFVIPGTGQPATYIYATEDGILSAWNSGASAKTVADRSAGDAVYKGLAIANDGTGNFIYATDFHNGKIDVFDQSFAYVSGRVLTDPNIPVGFAPFNIRNIGGQLFVTYAMQKGPDNDDDQSGPGNGYVDIYKPDGSLVKRFASQGTLNSPWGITQAPIAFGQGSGAILIGNFGDGRINVFDANGNYKSQLMMSGSPITIDGLWDIAFPASSAGGVDANRLYFTAGPSEETFGLFGYVKRK